jgi:hypothetical protein
MVVVVFGALVLAQLAYFYAFFHNVPGVLGAAGHQPGREGADVGAVPVEADAANHVLHVLFAQAGSGAMLAGRYAPVESVEQQLFVDGGHT